MRSKLSRKQFSLFNELILGLRSITASNLSWRDPLASRVISDDSDLVQNLPPKIQNTFLVTIIRETCRRFIANFNEHRTESLPEKLKHDSSWKESGEVLAEVATNILNTLNDVWNNPAFGPDFEDSLNEGTYVTNVIIPSIWSALKNLPFEKNAFISTSERQSLASADRKGDGQMGR
ncbi:unnamed protein product [Rhizophagus irregularis]|nr:unnamed protein product [Rhizophagus irregularis]CAB5362988.1 unnamed protein product [Rhizophagus irregularis]